jgi:Mg-chelatase subunit ChlD
MNHNVLFNRPTIKGWELRQGVEAFAHHACSAMGLRPINVIWRKGIQTAAIDAGGNVLLAAVADDATITRATLMRFCGFVVHELLHRKHTTFGSQYRLNPYLDSLHNACEDAWIEHSAIDAGLLGNVEGLLTALIEQMVAEAGEAVSDWSDPRQYPFLLAVWLRRHAKTKIALPIGLQPIFDQAAVRVLTCQSTDDTFKLAQWVYAQLQALPEDDQDGGSKPGDQPGDQDGDQDGPQDASDGPQSGDQGQGKGKGAAGQKKASAPSDHCEPAEVEPTVDAPKGGSGGSWHSGYMVINPKQHLRQNPNWSTTVTVPAKLRYEVRRLFEDTSSTMLSPNRKAGAINPRALHKFGQSDNLFQLRRDIDGIDSAVVICVDVSSSMFDDKDFIKNAVLTATALCETLESAGVKTAVLTFGCSVSLAAGFDDRLAVKRDALSRLGDGGSTNDFAAIRHAHDLLRVRPEQRKVCFVLTDGDGNVDEARRQAEGGETFGITTVGVGICHGVSHVYPKAVRVDAPADLARVALGQIKLAA